MRGPLAVLALASVGTAVVHFETLGEGGCHGTALGDIIAHTPGSAFKECATNPKCGGYWFGTIHEGDSETGEAQFFAAVRGANQRGMDDYPTAHCWKKMPTPSPTSTPTFMPTSKPTFRGPTCWASAEGHPTDEMGIGTVYQPSGPEYCNWCKCVCRTMMPGFAKSDTDPANCQAAEIRCTGKPCDKYKVIKTSAKKCEHVKCVYHEKERVQVQHHHLENHLNHKCNYNRLTYEGATQKRQFNSVSEWYGMYLKNEQGRKAWEKTQKEGKGVKAEDEACTCVCWDKIINYGKDGRGDGNRNLGYEYKSCSKVIPDKAIHWAKPKTGTWGPYIAPRPQQQKQMTQETCIKACEESEKCAGWSYRYGQPDHKHFQKCWLLDQTHVSYAPKEAKGKFHSGVCDWVADPDGSSRRNYTAVHHGEAEQDV